VNPDERRTRLWRDLGLGPLWRQRGPGEATSATAGAHEGVGLPADGPAAGAVERLDWDALQRTVAHCTACSLCKTRKQTVFGVGDRGARWMVIGEAPGAEEDDRGEPFVGQAGRLLDRMLAATGLDRNGTGEAAVYIANVLKCRPPGNRNPEPDEVARCEPFLRRQIELLAPRMILVMGRFAAQSLLGSDASIASLRGRVHSIEAGGRTLQVVVTYHPAYLLRNLADKAKVWADLCLAREQFERQQTGP
jgi:uracil-DNA glycosylase